jgi:hypothetical protein
VEALAGVAVRLVRVGVALVDLELVVPLALVVPPAVVVLLAAVDQLEAAPSVAHLPVGALAAGAPPARPPARVEHPAPAASRPARFFQALRPEQRPWARRLSSRISEWS